MSSNAVEVTINGEGRRIDPQNVTALVESEGLDPARPGLAVAINAMVVPRREWDNRTLQAGDVIEIVKPFSGG